MSIKTRLVRLERHRYHKSRIPRILVTTPYVGTDAESIERWQIENPGKPMPDDFIFLVPFSYTPGA